MQPAGADTHRADLLAVADAVGRPGRPERDPGARRVVRHTGRISRTEREPLAPPLAPLPL